MSFPSPTPKQGRVLWFSLTALSIAIVIGLLGVLAWGVGLVLKELSAVLMPLLLALVLAYILDPVVEYFVRKKLPRLWAILLVMFLGLLVVGGVIGSVIPDVASESRKLIEDLPRNTQVLRDRIDNFMNHSRLGQQLAASLPVASPAAKSPLATNAVGAATNTNAVEMTITVKTSIPGDGTASQTNNTEISAGTDELQKALNAPFSETVMPGLAKVVVFIVKWISARLSNVSTWAEFLLGFVLVPVYLFYLLLEKQGINRSWPDYLPLQESKAKDELVFVLRAINDCLIVFFRGQVLVALCVGTLLAVAYLIMGLNYALLLGLVAGLLGIVPYLGTIVSLVLALTVAAIQFGDWTHPLTVLGIAATVKLLEDLVISPKIMGKRSGLHPLTVIVAVMIGANLLGGFFGALLAIPFTAVLRTLMFRYVWKKRRSRESRAEAASG